MGTGVRGGPRTDLVNVSTLTAEEVGLAPSGEDQGWWAIELFIVNKSDPDVPIPDFTLSCRGAILAIRGADTADEAPSARKVGRLPYSISEPCNPGSAARPRGRHSQSSGGLP